MSQLIKDILRKNLSENKKSIIDVEVLLKFAEGIKLVCNHEYGDTFYNPETNSIFICLGDSNPFNEEYLESFIREGVTHYTDSDKIKIEIENEAEPPSDEGWMVYKKGKFTKWDGNYN